MKLHRIVIGVNFTAASDDAGRFRPIGPLLRRRGRGRSGRGDRGRGDPVLE